MNVPIRIAFNAHCNLLARIQAQLSFKYNSTNLLSGFSYFQLHPISSNLIKECCLKEVILKTQSNNCSQDWVAQSDWGRSVIPSRGCMCVYVLSHVQLFATPWMVAHESPLSVEFPRQDYLSGLSFPTAAEGT